MKFILFILCKLCILSTSPHTNLCIFSFSNKLHSNTLATTLSTHIIATARFAMLIFSSLSFSRYLCAVCGTFLTGPYVSRVFLCMSKWSPLRLSDIFLPFCCHISSYTQASSQELHPNPHISYFLTLTENGHVWAQAYVTSCLHSRVHAIKHTWRHRFRMREALCRVS